MRDSVPTGTVLSGSLEIPANRLLQSDWNEFFLIDNTNGDDTNYSQMHSIKSGIGTTQNLRTLLGCRK